MKNKIAALLATAALGGTAFAQDTGDLSISTTVGYESEYVFRGTLLGQASFQGSIDLSYAGAYATIWTSQPIDSDGFWDNEVDFVLGYSFAATDVVTLDVGATYYTYPETSSAALEDTLEAYIGAEFEAILSPSIYAFYDFDLETFTIESSIGYSIDLGDSAPNTSLDLGAYLGYADPQGASGDFYWGATADLSYAFTDSASASIGVRYAGNDYAAPAFNKDSFFWWGISFTAGF